MKKIVLLMILLLVIFPLTSCYQKTDDLEIKKEISKELVDESTDQEKLRVGITEGYYPYITVEDEKISGPYVEILSSALDKLGYEYEFIELPFSRLLVDVEEGNVDIAIPFFDRAERRAYAYYTEEAIGFSEMSLIGRKSVNIKLDDDFSALSNYRIGIVQDYYYSSEVENAIESGQLVIEEALTVEKNIEKLFQGRVDFIIEDVTFLEDYLKDHENDDKAYYIGDVVTNNYNYIVTSKLSDFATIRSELDLVLKSMKKEGIINDIYANYGLESYGESFKELQNTFPQAKKYFQEPSDEPIKVAVLVDTKPYVYHEEGELTGFVIDYMDEVLTRIGVEYEFVELPFNRMLIELENGIIDIGTDMYLKPEREVYGTYPKWPYIGYPTSIFKLSERDFDYDGDFELLKPYTLGYVRGYSLGPIDALKDNEAYEFIVTDSPKQNMDNLLNKRVDFIIDIQSTAENIIRELNAEEKVEVLSPPVVFEYSYNVFSKVNNLDNLVSEYETTVKSMYMDGTIKKLSEKYNVSYIEFDDNDSSD